MSISMALANALGVMKGRLSTAETENYKLLLCMAAGGLAPRGNRPESAVRIESFRTVVQCLKAMRIDGGMWRGRPDFMTDELLQSLQEESRQMHKVAKPTDRYLLGCGGTLADKFAVDAQLTNLVHQSFPLAHPTGIASYIFYDREGHGLDPHVDTDIYEINVIVMLSHEYLDKPSSLLIFDDDVEPERILLTPGEVLILNAGSVIHAREDMKQGESVSILTIGFDIPNAE